MDLLFFILILGVGLCACVILIFILKLVDRRKKWARCYHCGWEGMMDDPLAVCPECGYYNWE